MNRNKTKWDFESLIDVVLAFNILGFYYVSHRFFKNISSGSKHKNKYLLLIITLNADHRLCPRVSCLKLGTPHAH